MKKFSIRRLERCAVSYEIDAEDEAGAAAILGDMPEAHSVRVLDLLRAIGKSDDAFDPQSEIVEILEVEGGGVGERHGTTCERCGADLRKPASVELAGVVNDRYTFHITKLDGFGRIVDVDDAVKSRTIAGVGCSVCRCPIRIKEV